MNTILIACIRIHDGDDDDDDDFHGDDDNVNLNTKASTQKPKIKENIAKKKISFTIINRDESCAFYFYFL